MLQRIADMLNAREWYDNHKVATILSCKRKAYWHMQFQGGLATTVGPGATFGTTIHRGLEEYYNLWGKASLEQRQARAFRAFIEEHTKLFGSGDTLHRKHSLDRGLAMLAEYFDRFMIEDDNFEPIENELGAIITISPQPGDPPDFTEPFLYVVRLDGLWRRKSDMTLWVKETKTTSGSLDMEIKRLKLSRQIRGYTYAMRQWEPTRVAGVLADVLLVAAEKLSFARDFIPLTTEATDSWRRQTITVIEEWRRTLKGGGEKWSDMDRFTMNDGECSKYGSCSFYDLCYFGPGLARDTTYKQNLWTPFSIMEETLP